MRETRLLMICPTSRLTPDVLAREIHATGKDVKIKETCYGCLIEGEREVVREVTAFAREIDHNAVFSKRRAYKAGDPVRCRAQHGTRPGFAQLESEWEALPLIKAGLDAADNGEKTEEKPGKKKLPAIRFKDICEVK